MTETDTAGRGIRSTLRRWRAPLVLIPLAIGLGFAGVRGAELLWSDSVSAAADMVVTCWDGSEQSAEDCGDPTGVAGLRWAFPSFKPGDQRCTRAGASLERDGVLEFTCRQRLDGTPVRITYSERASLEREADYLDQRYPDVRATSTGDRAGDRTVYRDPAPRPNGTYEVAVSYDDFPFAVTVSGVNERLRDAALDDVVTLRPDRFMRVRPTRQAGTGAGSSSRPDETGGAGPAG